jgi:hypothetical protein
MSQLSSISCPTAEPVCATCSLMLLYTSCFSSSASIVSSPTKPMLQRAAGNLPPTGCEIAASFGQTHNCTHSRDHRHLRQRPTHQSFRRKSVRQPYRERRPFLAVALYKQTFPTTTWSSATKPIGDNLRPRVHGNLSSRETLSGVEPLSTFPSLSMAAVAFSINELSKLRMPADGLSSEARDRSGLRSRPRLRHLAWPSVTLPVEEIGNVKNECR